MAKAFGIIASTPRRINIRGLQDYRPAAAFSFCGRYRVIDFPISNLSNSGIDNIQVYLHDNPRSLTEHLGTGRHYNINSKRGKVQLLYGKQGFINDIYDTDVSEYLMNIDYIRRMIQDYVVIMPSYMVFKQDFETLLDLHIESGVDITMLYHKVDNARDHFLNCRYLTMDKERNVLSVEENHGNSKEKNIYMDTCIMKKSLFMDLVKKTVEYSSAYSLTQMIDVKCKEGKLKIKGFAHKGYFAAIDELTSYYDANMSLLENDETKDIFRHDWTIYTRTTDSCPSKITETAKVKGSLISNGCTIEGTVENCVIGRGVHIAKGAVVKNSILLAYAKVGENVTLDCQIVDKWANISKTKELISKPYEPGYIRRRDNL